MIVYQIQRRSELSPEWTTLDFDTNGNAFTSRDFADGVVLGLTIGHPGVEFQIVEKSFSLRGPQEWIPTDEVL